MRAKQNNAVDHLLENLNHKELILINKDFGFTKTELTYLLTLSARYRKNQNTILKKLILN